MSLWFRDYTLDDVHQLCQKTLVSHLGIIVTELNEKSIVGSMPVDERTKQPAGLLHGGASVVLAETLASIASNLMVDPAEFMAVGLEINANHLRPVKDGYVKGTATLFHQGKSTHVWDIRITNEKGDLVCISRMTASIVKKK